MIEVRYQPGVTPMVFFRGPRVGSADCYVDHHGELRTVISDQTMVELTNLGYKLEVLLPPGLDCFF